MNQQTELLEKSKTKLITLKQAKQYLRIEHNEDDEIIVQMLDAAEAAAENYLCVALQESKWRMTIYDILPSLIKLRYTPISKIEQFKLYKDNNEIIYLNSDHYIIDRSYEVIHMRRHYSIKKAEIEYCNGYNEERFPAPIRQGILEHLARLYDMRGSDQTLPLSAKSLYQPYRRVRL